MSAKERSSPGLHKAWSAPNGAFVIWLLSTVVLGLFGLWRDPRREHKEEHARISKLDREITVRLEYLCNAWFGSDMIRIGGDSTSAANRTDVDFLRHAALKAIELPGRSDEPTGVYPEFAERGLRSLIFELSYSCTARSAGLPSDTGTTNNALPPQVMARGQNADKVSGEFRKSLGALSSGG
jgi:hypothetical protein